MGWAGQADRDQSRASAEGRGGPKHTGPRAHVVPPIHHGAAEIRVRIASRPASRTLGVPMAPPTSSEKSRRESRDVSRKGRETRLDLYRGPRRCHVCRESQEPAHSPPESIRLGGRLVGQTKIVANVICGHVGHGGQRLETEHRERGHITNSQRIFQGPTRTTMTPSSHGLPNVSCKNIQL